MRFVPVILAFPRQDCKSKGSCSPTRIEAERLYQGTAYPSNRSGCAWSCRWFLPPVQERAVQAIHPNARKHDNSTSASGGYGYTCLSDRSVHSCWADSFPLRKTVHHNPLEPAGEGNQLCSKAFPKACLYQSCCSPHDLSICWPIKDATNLLVGLIKTS